MSRNNSKGFEELPSTERAKQLTLEDLKALRGVSREGGGWHGSEDTKLLGQESGKVG